MALNKTERRQRIHYRIRKHVNGTAERPRMVVFRSNKYIYVQVVDDVKGVTLVAAASNDKRKSYCGARERERHHYRIFRPRRLSLSWQS